MWVVLTGWFFIASCLLLDDLRTAPAALNPIKQVDRQTITNGVFIQKTNHLECNFEEKTMTSGRTSEKKS